MNKPKLLPPVWFLLSIILMIGLHWWLPIKQLIEPPFTYGGIVAIVISILIVVACERIFRQKGTSNRPFEESSCLVNEGLFKYSRNPIYLGMVVFLIGLWLVLGSLSPLVVIPFFVGLIQSKFIKVEEKMLEEKFGEEYQEYKVRVRRWI